MVPKMAKEDLEDLKDPRSPEVRYADRRFAEHQSINEPISN